jgi:primosomal protein N' (replication factor Y)
VIDRYAQVIVDAEHLRLPQPFTYRVPPDAPYPLPVGACVLVPFGTRRLVGYVVECIAEPTTTAQIKDLHSILDSPPAFDPLTYDLVRWTASRYHCGLLEVLRCFLPEGMSSHIRKLWRVRDADSPDRVSQQQLALLQAIKQMEGSASAKSLGDSLGEPASPTVLKALVSKGLLEEVYVLEPPRLHSKLQSGVRLAKLPTEEDLQALERRTKAQAGLLRALSQSSEPQAPRLTTELIAATGAPDSALKSLVKKGWLEACQIAISRNPVSSVRAVTFRPSLTEDQRRTLAEILRALSRQQPSVPSRSSAPGRRFLLHGVTASGKTEVYLQAIQRCVESGRQALLLVPEIALTAQVLETIKGRFGTNAAVLHSRLSDGERYDEWQRIARGDARVVVGARSAVFAPLRNLGLVILDEEHETSYKQDSSPRYHTRDVAAKRAELSRAVLVLGSATPSIETFQWAQERHLSLLEMPRRIDDRPLPVVELVDLRATEKPPTIFSEQLLDRLRDRLSRGEQAILFLNRRGYATFVLCRDCGYAARCPNCSVTLTYHAYSNLVQCHHCGHQRVAPTKCPKCGGDRIRHFGLGTERLEAEAKKLLPEARTIRMDQDTTSRKGSHQALLRALREGEANLLIGTQMVAKGLDFPQVTLVGVVAADTSLNLPDFRAAERTFQLLTQVSGRAGRGVIPGEVIVQTFNPEHYSLQAASHHDFQAFFDKEIVFRRELDYPPFTRLASLVYSRHSREEAERLSRSMVRALQQTLEEQRSDAVVLGPAPAPLERLKTRYRWRSLIKARNIRVLNALLNAALERIPAAEQEGLLIDVDPVSLL